MVALTFHGDGDPDLAVRVLNALTAGAAPSTIFAVGSWLEDNPGLARRALDGGHELANHTYRHLSMGQLGGEEVSEEIDKGRLIEVLPKFAVSGSDIYAVYPDRKFLPAKVRLFIDFMKKIVGDPPYWERNGK